MTANTQADSFAARLLDWHAVNGRKELPWQKERTAYRVWVSEIMLQQTQVNTVIPYYLRFMEAFPDVVTLADAGIDRVLELWSGLGYYARARNLYQAACEIRDYHGGEFPGRFDDIVALPGIGRSTAGAIAALARGERHAILDGNVKRVLARYHAVCGWPGSSAVARQLWEYAEHHTPAREVASYTQAIMDLGATVCTRSRPACNRCPLRTECVAYLSGSVDDYPGKRPKKDKPLRQVHMLLAFREGDIYLEQRPPAGIWGGLWSLPEFEREDDLRDWCLQRFPTDTLEIVRWETLRHSFSHYDLDIQPVAVRISDAGSGVADGGASVWHEYRKPAPFGVAAPVLKLIDNLKSAR